MEEGLQPHKVKEVWLWAAEDPNHRSDITDTFDIKMAALGCHKSQVGDIPPEMRKHLIEWAKANAEGEDFELAEAFHRVEMRY